MHKINFHPVKSFRFYLHTSFIFGFGGQAEEYAFRSEPLGHGWHRQIGIDRNRTVDILVLIGDILMNWTRSFHRFPRNE
jgi:hypothetical protein